MDRKVAVVGLGYVGLPLALAFGRVMPTLGFEISETRVKAYQDGRDPNGEMGPEKFQQAGKIVFSADPQILMQADFVVVAVPTPIDRAKQPDLSPLLKSSETVGRNLKRGAIVIYESTVYPGVTEEVCVPILEQESGLKCGQDFFVGYSPERINPGDKINTLESIIKVVSGQDENTTEQVAWLYEQVIEAGVHRAPSIMAAEAAKVIENTQRDLNIALMNELAIIFGMLGIDTLDVLEASGTKWNFLPFRPGLVGGHCIGVDPYYLTHKAQMIGYHPEVILAGRRINDGMGKYVADQTVKMMIKDGRTIKGAKVLVMGLTFKENCPDLRNSRVIDVIRELEAFDLIVKVWDPVANSQEAMDEYAVQLVELDEVDDLEAIVAAVSHNDIVSINLDDLAKKSRKSIPFLDIKSVFDRDALRGAGFDVWRL